MNNSPIIINDKASKQITIGIILTNETKIIEKKIPHTSKIGNSILLNLKKLICKSTNKKIIIEKNIIHSFIK
jgi:hypothetical protein